MRTAEFSLVIPGDPHGWGRARLGRAANGRPLHFTDAKTRTYAQIVQTEWALAGRPTLPPGPYGLTVAVYFRRPPSHFRRDGQLSAAGLRAPYPGKPDLDNVCKLLLDALVAVGALPDDRHLVDLFARKEWSGLPVSPGVVVDAVTMAEVEEAA